MPGIILILMGLFVGALHGVFRRIPNQGITSGQIVSLERAANPERGRTRYAAWVEYEVNGIMYAVKSKICSSTFYTGQRVRVAYNQADPQVSYILPQMKIYLIMAAFIVAGIAVLIQIWV